MDWQLQADFDLYIGIEMENHRDSELLKKQMIIIIFISDMRSKL